MKDIKGISKVTRLYRKIHNTTGSFLFVLFLIISVTGLLLGWKKHSAGLILPPTERGLSSNLENWLTFEQLNGIAVQTLQDSLPGLSPELDRIDARPEKGVVKFVFKNHYTEIQVDCTTGKVLAVNRRTSDIIEQIHDGSILDFALDTSNNQIKLSYTTIVGLSLLTLTVTGFFLWLNPIRIRRLRHKGSGLE
jgi:uncharacterized iron-regulated membrane protein